MHPRANPTPCPPHVVPIMSSLSERFALASTERASPATGVVDAWLWVLVPAITLSMIHIGYVSGDGLAQSATYARHTWFWNPNHLLYEPLCALWQTVVGHFLARPGTDVLKLLSIWSAAIAAGLFRWGVAEELCPSRAVANFATAWVVLGSVCSRMAISDEPQIVQLPWIVLMAIVTLRYVRHPRMPHALLLGAATGMAALFTISNVLLGAALGCAIASWHVYHHEWKPARQFLAAISLGTVGVAATVFLFAWWLFIPHQVGLVHWLTTYGGGAAGDRVAGSYGMEFTVHGIITATAHALYGAGSAIVDLAPLVEPIRDGQQLGVGQVAVVLAFIAGSSLLVTALWRTVRARPTTSQSAVLIIVAAWVAAVLAFGVYWNNSDDQFYIQLAVPIGVLAAMVPWYRANRVAPAALLGMLVLGWNTWQIERRIAYPRTMLAAALTRMVQGAQLVVYPGMDEVDNLFYFSTEPSHHRVALTAIATRYPADRGLPMLKDSIQNVLQHGGKVEIVSIFDVPKNRNPWKYLRRLGYDQQDIRALLERFPLDHTRRIGPFTARSITQSWAAK